jgi:hypothetical protein
MKITISSKNLMSKRVRSKSFRMFQLLLFRSFLSTLVDTKELVRNVKKFMLESSIREARIK